MKKEFVTYSEAFKMQVVEEIRLGKFATVLQAQKACGICGMPTVQKWLKKYGVEELLPKRVRVETTAEIDELKEAKKRIRDLEKALSDSHMDYCLERAFLEIACEEMGTSREDLKKTTPYGDVHVLSYYISRIGNSGRALLKPSWCLGKGRILFKSQACRKH